jgi:hypothetical protein
MTEQTIEPELTQQSVLTDISLNLPHVLSSVNFEEPISARWDKLETEKAVYLVPATSNQRVKLIGLSLSLPVVFVAPVWSSAWMDFVAGKANEHSQKQKYGGVGSRIDPEKFAANTISISKADILSTEVSKVQVPLVGRIADNWLTIGGLVDKRDLEYLLAKMTAHCRIQGAKVPVEVKWLLRGTLRDVERLPSWYRAQTVPPVPWKSATAILAIK